MSPEICIIAAIAGKDRVIGIGEGKEAKVPWPRISADMRRFKSKTSSHPIIMGRKTFESLGRPLPERPNIVITRNPDYKGEGISLAYNIDDAIMYAETLDQERIFIIGGGEIYRQSIRMADRLLLTLVEGDYSGDTFFPDYSDFREIVSEEFGEEKGIKYKFVELTK